MRRSKPSAWSDHAGGKVKIGVFVTAGSVCCLLCQCARNDQREAERYIVESERQWAESVATGDPSVVEQILADDFLGVDPKGRLYDKVKMITDTRTAPQYFVSNRVNEVKVRFYGDTAIAQGNESWERSTGERGRFVWTDTWIRRNGRCQIVAAEDLIAPESSR
ncbi:MAG TPA: nuclear transport factor 2 family protein [Candidatus Udaeobacter sp.]|nr:nuclear transport factor 2 family protein [Candidatus Udaeobacter sp.]